MARFADTFGRGDWCSFVDLQPDGIFLLPLGAARSSPHHRSESVRWGAAAGRMGHLYTRSVCLSGAHWTYSERLVLGTLVWVLTDYGFLNPDRPSLLSWIALISIGVILGIGLCWSLLRARVTGQVEVD